jgi:preprotein translocase subunit SecE
MSAIRSEDGKKWINTFIALIAILVGFISIKLFDQLGEWFDLEAKIAHFLLVKQFVGVLAGTITFVAIIKNKSAFTHLEEVYAELLKVIWPENDVVLKLTLGIIVGISIVSMVFVFVDFVFNKLLDMFY